MTSTPMRTRVLIVGAGPVGLATAIELGSRAIPCVVVERNPRVGYAPRAKTTNIRTREHMRRWGIADKLAAASPLGIDYPSNVLFVTRLSGYELARFENALYCAPGRNPLYSEHSQWIPQYAVEEVMRAHAQSLPGVEIRFNCEMVSFEQDAHGVRATVRNVEGGARGGSAGGGNGNGGGTGSGSSDVTDTATTTIAADFLVGADGSRSTVREAIGARMEGTHGLSRNYNVVFRAPGMADAHSHGPAIMYWQVNADVPSLIGPMDRGDKWYFMPTGVPDGVRFSPSDAPELIRRSTGIDRPYEVLSSDEWVASRLLATHYRDRRVFLAGDACHLHPPFGGYGMNMGIADGVDLGWKIAAVLQGWGGPTLLDSYETERRPVHSYVMDEAVTNHSTLANHLRRDGIEDATDAGAAIRRDVGIRIQAAKVREFNTLGVVLGSRYEGSPVIVDDGSEPPVRDFLNYVPSAHPGCLAPHAWLHDGTSLYDHFGRGFTLLAIGGRGNGSSDMQDEIEHMRAAAHAADVPLKVLRPAEAVLSDLYQARFTLIRPDQHVAWRGASIPVDAETLLLHVTGRQVRREAADGWTADFGRQSLNSPQKPGETV